jgi:transcriptional regulator with XRE-family HTH domain
MGHGKRPRPKSLGSKLRHIRECVLGITQEEMAKRLRKLGGDKTLHSGYIADYENNRSREPSLLTLLAYSKLTGISVNEFIDDKLDISEMLSNLSEHSPVMKTAKRKKR